MVNCYIDLHGSLVCAINLVNATTGSIWTTSDLAGTIETSQFAPGQTVYIFWEVNPSGSADVEIWTKIGDNMGVVLVDFGPIAGTSTSWIAQEGEYYIRIEGVGTFPIAVASIFVVPESVLGTVMATVTGFAAFGAVYLIKHKR